MASKADLDNHSNQLNPNNDEYGNSRGWGRDDDDSEEDSASGARGYGSRVSTPLAQYNEEFSLGVRIAIVSLTGRARYIAFRTSHAPILKSVHYIENARCRNEEFADLLLNEVARQLKLQWGEQLATYILYSENGRQIVVYSSYVFPAALSRGKPELQLWNDHGKAAVESAHALLSVPADAQIPGIEDWGTIYDNPSKTWTSLSPGLHHCVTKLLAVHPDNGSLVL